MSNQGTTTPSPLTTIENWPTAEEVAAAINQLREWYGIEDYVAVWADVVQSRHGFHLSIRCGSGNSKSPSTEYVGSLKQAVENASPEPTEAKEARRQRMIADLEAQIAVLKSQEL